MSKLYIEVNEETGIPLTPGGMGILVVITQLYVPMTF